MEQDREDYETNTYQDDINEDPEEEPLLAGDDTWDLDDPGMDEELVREIQEQEHRDYTDFLAEEVDEDKRLV